MSLPASGWRDSAGFTFSAAKCTCSEKFLILKLSERSCAAKSIRGKWSKVWPSELVLSWEVALRLMCPKTIQIKRYFNKEENKLPHFIKYLQGWFWAGRWLWSWCALKHFQSINSMLIVDFPRNYFVSRWLRENHVNDCIFTCDLLQVELESCRLGCAVTAAWSKSQLKFVQDIFL